MAWIKVKVGKFCVRAKWPIRSELIPVSVAWSDWEYFYSPLDGMLVHRRVTPNVKFASAYLCAWVERGTVRVNCLAQEHNTMFPARAARSGDERTNHEATAPPLHCRDLVNHVRAEFHILLCGKKTHRKAYIYQKTLRMCKFIRDTFIEMFLLCWTKHDFRSKIDGLIFSH